jgi:hypothetical protein
MKFIEDGMKMSVNTDDFKNVYIIDVDIDNNDGEYTNSEVYLDSEDIAEKKHLDLFAVLACGLEFYIDFYNCCDAGEEAMYELLSEEYEITPGHDNPAAMSVADFIIHYYDDAGIKYDVELPKPTKDDLKLTKLRCLALQKHHEGEN